MKTFWFYDIGTMKNIFIKSETISGAIIESLQMVLDGTAVHPVYITQSA